MKTPKLYFYDVGLACALLGISEPSQLRTHPLRGALFENWVITEILKARFNRGLHWPGFFLRDRKGFEVDLVMDAGDRLIALEVKSGQTIAGGFFANLEKLLALQTQVTSHQRIDPIVVYGGDQRQRRRQIGVIPWNKVKDKVWW